MQTDPLKAEALRQLQQAVEHDYDAYDLRPAYDELRSRIAQNDHHTRPSSDFRGATE